MIPGPILHSLSVITLSILLLNSALAQKRELTSQDQRAVTSYRNALAAYDKNDYKLAEALLMDAISRDSDFIEAHIVLSQLLQELGRADESIAMARRVIELNPNFFPRIRLNLGNLLLAKGDYLNAREQFYLLIASGKLSENVERLARLGLSSSEFALESLANPVPFQPINLGPNINSPLDEYWPSLSADENTLVITINAPKDPSIREIIYNRQEDFYISTRDTNGELLPVKNIGAPINTPMHNEGAQSLTADGQSMYFTVCTGLCNLFVSNMLPNGQWSRPERLPPPVNQSRSSEKQPSISPDGQTLYFVSNRVDGFGDFDIWRSTRTGENTWSNPENLGPTLNTPFNEQSPFIHFDNKTLYFASDGHTGMGGLDIYVTRMLTDTSWAWPQNLGYPINTHHDEDGLVVNTRGTTAYFSSDINPEMGRDIFRFELHEAARPKPVSYVRGLITDARTGWPLRANVKLVDLDSGEELMNSYSQADGHFLVCIPTSRRYGLFALATGYLYSSSHFDLVGIHTVDKPFRKDMELEPIRIGSTLVMRNIFFETNSYALLDVSLVELNKLVELLNMNPAIRIEVGGHTDSVGGYEHNMILSGSRAKAVTDYLVSRSISSARITWKGYGESKPIDTNETEEGRAGNRRTEIRIIDGM